MSLRDFRSVGPQTEADLNRLGIYRQTDLMGKDPALLFQQLQELDGVEHDICTLDVFRAAVAQATQPDLPDEKKNWWYWSRIRKSEGT